MGGVRGEGELQAVAKAEHQQQERYEQRRQCADTGQQVRPCDDINRSGSVLTSTGQAVLTQGNRSGSVDTGNSPAAASRDHRGPASRDHRGPASRDHRGPASRDHRGPASRDHRGP